MLSLLTQDLAQGWELSLHLSAPRVSLVFLWLCLLNVSKTRSPQQSHRFLASSHRKWKQQQLFFTTAGWEDVGLC